MTGEQDVGRLVAQLHHRDLRAERLDRKHQLRAQDAREVIHVARDVFARHIEEIQPLERQRLIRTSVTHREGTLRDHPGTLTGHV